MKIIVIGTSAGGMEALDMLIGQLPTDICAAILVVQHMSPENSGAALVHRLGRHKAFQCGLAVNEEALVSGRIYIAPADAHLLVKRDHVLVTKGARENRYRPGIDPLFRSAAVTHTSRVIGVLLTGMLDDGTAGLTAIKKCGGVTVVQDPKDAAYPEMPQSALNAHQVDYCVPLSRMGELLEHLARERAGKKTPVPEDIRIEATIAERALSDVGRVSRLGKQVPYNCPNCGGVLWEVESSETMRYRCHNGHSYTSAALLTSQTEKIEETLWVSLRMFEERRNLLNNMAQESTNRALRRSYLEKAQETDIHVQRIRAMLVAPGPQAQ